MSECQRSRNGRYGSRENLLNYFSCILPSIVSIIGNMPKRIRIKLSQLFKVYDCGKEGLPIGAVAELIGVAKRTFTRNAKLMRALKLGRKVYRERKKSDFNMQEYVYKRLPAHLQKVWDEITAVEKTDNGYQKVEVILNKAGTKVRQNLFIHSWVCSNFCISKALRKVNISRAVFDKWRENDPEFLELINQIEVCKKDFFEEKLVSLVAHNNTKAILHVNKTKNRDRGYGEKTVVEVTGNVNHQLIRLDELDMLPLEERQKLLNAVRDRRKQIESKELPAVEIKEAQFAQQG